MDWKNVTISNNFMFRLVMENLVARSLGMLWMEAVE